jgi:hypothetical protein
MKTIQNNMIKLSEKLFGIILIMFAPAKEKDMYLSKVFVRDNINQKKVLGEIYSNPLLTSAKRKL